MLDELLLERREREINRPLPRLKILLRQFAVTFELFLRLLDERFSRGLQDISASRFERFRKRDLRLVNRATSLRERFLTCGDALFIRTQFLLRFGS